jgi:cell shape-determining protein MreC
MAVQVQTIESIIPEQVRESIASLSEKLAMEQKRRLELEKKCEQLKQKLMQITVLAEEKQRIIYDMYILLDRKTE